MKGRIIFTCVFVTALLGSHAVSASPNAANQENNLQETAGHVAAIVEAKALTTNLLNILNYDNHAETVQRIIADSRHELSRQLNASNLVLEALEFSDSYLKLSISTSDGKLDLTAR